MWPFAHFKFRGRAIANVGKNLSEFSDFKAFVVDKWLRKTFG